MRNRFRFETLERGFNFESSLSGFNLNYITIAFRKTEQKKNSINLDTFKFVRYLMQAPNFAIWRNKR